MLSRLVVVCAGLIALTAALTPMPAAAADRHITGTIHTLTAHQLDNAVYMYLEGKPVFGDGTGTCDSFWTANSMDDAKFHDFIYPLLITAKASGLQVKVSVDGCLGSNPKIYAVEFEPRE